MSPACENHRPQHLAVAAWLIGVQPGKIYVLAYGVFLWLSSPYERPTQHFYNEDFLALVESYNKNRALSSGGPDMNTRDNGSEVGLSKTSMWFVYVEGFQSEGSDYTLETL